MPTIPSSTRFYQPGIVKIYWLPAVAAADLTPTRLEITGGTDLTPEVDDIAGWSYSTTFIETKDANSRIRTKLAAAVTLDDSSITFNGSQDGEDVRTVLTRGDTGFVMWCDGGDVEGQPAEVFPVEVGAVVLVRSLTDAPFKVRVDFGVTNVPQPVVIPAAA